MTRTTRTRMGLLLVAAGVLLVASTALAQPGGYSLDWWTVDGGGGTLRAGGYTLKGTAGQPDAGALRGGEYTLLGGFWGGMAAAYRIYLPLVLRNG